MTETTKSPRRGVAKPEGHTALPLRHEQPPSLHGPANVILDADDHMVCEAYDGPDEKDAAYCALICRAVNSHADLVKALAAMVDRWEPDCGGQDRIMWENACAALARAKEQTP